MRIWFSGHLSSEIAPRVSMRGRHDTQTHCSLKVFQILPFRRGPVMLDSVRNIAERRQTCVPKVIISQARLYFAFEKNLEV